jgi:hypothetical protein
MLIQQDLSIFRIENRRWQSHLGLNSRALLGAESFDQLAHSPKRAFSKAHREFGAWGSILRFGIGYEGMLAALDEL